MTYYSVDTGIRNVILFVLAAISLLLSTALQEFQSVIPYHLVAPSAMMIFGTVVLVFDIFLWKIWPFRWLSGIPNINGRWKGKVTSRRSASKTEELEATATITQSFFRIQIVLETTRTISTSEVVGMFIDNRSFPVMKYSYAFRNKTGLEAVKTRGEGFNELRYSQSSSARTLEGTYFGTNGRVGFLTLSYQQ